MSSSNRQSTKQAFLGPIVNARYSKNRTKAGRPSSKAATQKIHYISYGHSFDNPKRLLRGQWYGVEGEQEPEQIASWGKQAAKDHRYTYTVIVSMRDAQMQDGDYIAAMKRLCQQTAEAELVTEWRMMVHQDSSHQHAHVVFFRDKTLRKGELAQVREHIQQELLAREAALKRQLEQNRGIAIE